MAGLQALRTSYPSRHSGSAPQICGFNISNGDGSFDRLAFERTRSANRVSMPFWWDWMTSNLVGKVLTLAMQMHLTALHCTAVYCDDQSLQFMRGRMVSIAHVHVDSA